MRIERIPVVMVCNHLNKEVIVCLAKAYSVPGGFYIRNYIKGEENIWAEIETAAEEFNSEQKALECFLQDFGQYRDEMEKCCFFIIDKKSGRAVGTTTAWYNNNFACEKYGRIHWVGIHPDFQVLLKCAILYYKIEVDIFSFCSCISHISKTSMCRYSQRLYNSAVHLNILSNEE